MFLQMRFIIFSLSLIFFLIKEFFLFESKKESFIKYRYNDVLLRCAMNLTVIYFPSYGGLLLQQGTIVSVNHRLSGPTSLPKKLYQIL